MKKFFIIIIEIIIILCLIIALIGKVFANQRKTSLELISSKIGTTKVLARNSNLNNKSSFLWTQAVVDLSSEPETRESFKPQRTTLLTQENKLSELYRLRNKGAKIKTTSTEFLWTDVKANPYGDSEKKEDFLSERVALYKQENRAMPRKNIAVIQTTSTEFLWTDIKVNPYGDSATKETFSARRAELLRQEKYR